MYPSGTASADIYGTPKMRNFSSSDLFAKLCPIVSIKQALIFYNIPHFVGDLLSHLVPNDCLWKDTFSFSN